jgi:hypothetical protein
MDGAEQECSGYILSLASGMLGLHFVLGIIPARPAFTYSHKVALRRTVASHGDPGC